MKYQFLAVLLILSCLTTTTAQEQIGLRLGRYAGVSGLILNPSDAPFSAYPWELNLLEISHYSQTNYAFISNTSIPDLIRNGDQVIVETDLDPDNPPGPNDRVLYFNDTPRKYALSTLTTVMGPSVMFNIRDQHGIGVFVRARAGMSNFRLPNVFGYENFENLNIGEPVDVSKFSLAGMSWMEIGVNYAHRIQTDIGSIGFGGSVKFLRGYESFFVRSAQDLTFQRNLNDTLQFAQADLTFGFTRGNENADTDGFSLQQTGSGVGIDLGFTYTIDGVEEGVPALKIGVSVLDIGSIQFDRFSEQHRLSVEDGFDISTRDFESVTEVDEAILTLNEEVYDATNVSLEASSYRIWLPAALSIQADAYVMPNVFVGSALVQRIPMGTTPMIQRPNLFVVAPRYETRWFALAFPVNVYNWQDFRLGTSVRLGFLTIGSEDLGSFVGRGDVNGTDFYLALKVNPFKMGFSNRGRSWGSRGKGAKCYTF